MIRNVYWCSCTVPVILVIVMKLHFYRHIFEKYPYKKYHKNPSSCFTRTDRQTDVAKLLVIVAFRTFVKASKNRRTK